MVSKCLLQQNRRNYPFPFSKMMHEDEIASRFERNDLAFFDQTEKLSRFVTYGFKVDQSNNPFVSHGSLVWDVKHAWHEIYGEYLTTNSIGTHGLFILIGQRETRDNNFRSMNLKFEEKQPFFGKRDIFLNAIVFLRSYSIGDRLRILWFWCRRRLSTWHSFESDGLLQC